MRPPLFALISLGLLAATPAWSAPWIAPVVAPAVVRAGGEYATVIPKLPAAVEELELFLLPEDGSGRMLRLTPEREAADGALRWRMPRIGAGRARLVLRAGGGFGEAESEPSAFFLVEDPAERGPAEVRRGADELAWHFGDGPASEAALGSPGAPKVQASAHLGTAAEGPDAPLAGPPAGGSPARETLARDPSPIPAATSHSRRPPRVPMRN